MFAPLSPQALCYSATVCPGRLLIILAVLLVRTHLVYIDLGSCECKGSAMRVSVLLRLQRRYIYIAWQRPRRRQKIVSHFSCLADALLLQSNLKILEIVLTFRTLFRRKSELAATTATRTDQDNFPNDPLVKLAEVCFQATGDQGDWP